MATDRRFVVKSGLDNNGNSISNLGTLGSSLQLSGAYSLTLTLTGNTNVTLPTSGTLATLNDIKNAALTLATSGNGISGTASFSANSDTPTTFTVTSNATASNTASTIVFRDSSGNFAAGTITAALSGNAATASALQTARTISVSGDASWSVSFDGSANATSAITLATVNSSPVTSSLAKITVNGKGLVTSSTAATSADVISIIGYTPVNKAGDTMGGFLSLHADPTSAMHAATKQYVDNVASGLNIHLSCRAATTANLTATYANGTSGVGATLTGTGALPAIDGITLAANDRVLIKNQTTQTHNGIYVVTTLSPNWVLTRATDFDGSPTNEVMAGDCTYVQEGTQQRTHWVQTTPSTVVLGTSSIVFTQFGGPGLYTSGTGINISGANVISNTGVTSIAGTTNQVSVSSSTGAVTVSLPSSVTISGTMTAGTFSGNGSSLTNLDAGAISTGTLTITRGGTGLSSSGTANQILGMNSGGTGLEYKTISGSSSVSVSHTANAITLSLGVELDGLAALNTNGIIARTGTGSYASRTINVSGNGLSVTNGNAVSGNPTIASNATATNTASTIVFRDASGNFAAGTITAALSGNATTATALQTARNFSITGSDVTASAVSFNGSADVALSASLTATGVTAGTYTKVTVDSKGRVTAGANPVSLETTVTSVTTTTQTVVDSVPASLVRSIKYLVQIEDTTNSHYHVEEILLTHNGSTVFKTEYAEVVSNAPLGSFDADILAGNVRLLFTAVAGSTKVAKAYRSAIYI